MPTAEQLIQNGIFNTEPVLTPAQITADQNDYAPAGIDIASLLRVSSNALRSITGIKAPVNSKSKPLSIVNVGSFTLILNANDVGSAAANRFGFPGAVVLSPNSGVLIQYDSISSLWRSITEPLIVPQAINSYTMTTQGIGTARQYVAGFYDFPVVDANLTQASTTVTHGVAGRAVGAHASAVIGGPGSVDAGVVGLRVNGTSITDQGVRTAGDSETLSSDITTLALNQYLETSIKWLGQVTFEIFTVSGTPTLVSLDFNYGFSKYDDFSNRDFIVRSFQAVWLAGANDANFDLILFYHSLTGWTYSVAAFVPGGTVLAQLSTDYVTEDQLIIGERGAYKRDDLNQLVNGAGSEGIVIAVSVTANNAIEFLDANVGVFI